ncbi:MAG TPA: hypothetical protein VM532_03560 [Burkholderiales bacterium]|nr:hypothetical protein [Burkholderiales bacterium]
MEKADLYLKLFQEYASEARHHEQQRATVTGFFSALAAGVLTIVGIDKALSVADIPAALFLVVIGVFGCVFSAKQYERFFVCMERARQYRLALQEAVPGSNIIELKRTADRKALERFPRLHVWRLGIFWVALHALIASFGVLLLVLSIVGVGCKP